MAYQAQQMQFHKRYAHDTWQEYRDAFRVLQHVIQNRHGSMHAYLLRHYLHDPPKLN